MSIRPSVSGYRPIRAIFLYTNSRSIFLLREGSVLGFLRRTPAPPPFSSMNSFASLFKCAADYIQQSARQR